MKQDKNWELLDLQFAKGKKRLKMVLTYFGGSPKLDIREYYLDTDEEFKPSKKGVQLDPHKAEAVRSALEENAQIIDSHLLSTATQQWAGKVKKIQTSNDFFSRFEFFKCSSDGSTESIAFNPNHPVGRRLSELDHLESDEVQEALLILKRILIAHQHSLSQFDEAARVIVGDFIQDHSQIWSALLKRLEAE